MCSKCASDSTQRDDGFRRAAFGGRLHGTVILQSNSGAHIVRPLVYFWNNLTFILGLGPEPYQCRSLLESRSGLVAPPTPGRKHGLNEFWLLSRHPMLRKMVFKLWFSSAKISRPRCSWTFRDLEALQRPWHDV